MYPSDQQNINCLPDLKPFIPHLKDMKGKGTSGFDGQPSQDDKAGTVNNEVLMS